MKSKSNQALTQLINIINTKIEDVKEEIENENEQDSNNQADSQPQQVTFNINIV